VIACGLQRPARRGERQASQDYYCKPFHNSLLLKALDGHGRFLISESRSALRSRCCCSTAAVSVTQVSYHDDSHGNAVVTVDNAGETITVHSADLHPRDFHFTDHLAAAPADTHLANAAAAHAFLL
jgi:hypothetical protein